MTAVGLQAPDGMRDTELYVHMELRRWLQVLVRVRVRVRVRTKVTGEHEHVNCFWAARQGYKDGSGFS